MKIRDILREMKYWHFTRRADKLGWWVAKHLSPMMQIRVVALTAGKVIGEREVYNATYYEMHQVLSEEMKRGQHRRRSILAL